MNERLYFQESLSEFVFKQAKKRHLMQQCICYQLDLADIDVQHFQNLSPPKYLEQAVSKRRLEFYSGRILIQAILAQYFDFHEGITSYVQRLPQWVSPWLGSISHSKNQAVAVVSADMKYIGIDLEHWVGDDLLEDGQHLILNAQDLKIWGEITTEFSFQQFLTLVFSMKESLYKAIYPQAKQYIDFLDASIAEISLIEQHVKLKFSEKVQHKFQLFDEYEGYWSMQEDYVLTWVCKLKS